MVVLGGGVIPPLLERGVMRGEEPDSDPDLLQDTDCRLRHNPRSLVI